METVTHLTPTCFGQYLAGVTQAERDCYNCPCVRPCIARTSALRDAKATLTKTVRESDIEDYAVAQVRKAGGQIRKAQWVARRGCPDRKIMFKNSKPNPWVEFKRPGEVPRENQADEIAEMRAHGETVLVIDSFAGVDDMIRAYA